MRDSKDVVRRLPKDVIYKVNLHTQHLKGPFLYFVLSSPKLNTYGSKCISYTDLFTLRKNLMLRDKLTIGIRTNV